MTSRSTLPEMPSTFAKPWSCHTWLLISDHSSYA
jgi:hypothetical protein